jgi:hypothetical protein
MSNIREDLGRGGGLRPKRRVAGLVIERLAVINLVRRTVPRNEYVRTASGAPAGGVFRHERTAMRHSAPCRATASTVAEKIQYEKLFDSIAYLRVGQLTVPSLLE